MSKLAPVSQERKQHCYNTILVPTAKTDIDTFLKYKVCIANAMSQSNLNYYSMIREFCTYVQGV